MQNCSQSLILRKIRLISLLHMRCLVKLKAVLQQNSQFNSISLVVLWWVCTLKGISHLWKRLTLLKIWDASASLNLAMETMHRKWKPLPHLIRQRMNSLLIAQPLKVKSIGSPMVHAMLTKLLSLLKPSWKVRMKASIAF